MAIDRIAESAQTRMQAADAGLLVRQKADWPKRIGFILLTSITFPALLLWQAWKTSSFTYKHWLATAFVTVYGSTIAIAYDPLGVGADGVRHLLHVYVHYVGLVFPQFLQELGQIIALQENASPSRDVYKHVLSYIAGGVLGVPELFFPMVAFIYGYFFTGSLLIVFRNFGATRLTYVFVGFAVLFFLAKNIEGVNTVRTWTGMWILVYACLKYYETRRLGYALLMFVPPFIHFGYFMMAIPAWLVLAVGNWPRVFAVLFILSSFTTFLNPGTVAEIVSTTELGERATHSYFREEMRSREEILQRSAERGQRIWRTLNQFGLHKWALNILVFSLLIANVYSTVMNRYQKTIFSIGLLTITFSNATWYLYALSNRSWLIGAVFILAAYLIARQDPLTSRRLPNALPIYKYGINIALVLFFPWFLFQLSVLFDFPSVFLLALPFMVLLSPEINMSMKEGLRWLLGIGR